MVPSRVEPKLLVAVLDLSRVTVVAKGGDCDTLLMTNALKAQFGASHYSSGELNDAPPLQGWITRTLVGRNLDTL